MQDFKKLLVWRKAHELALLVYRSTAAFPRAEMFGLTAQLRRAAVSVPSNIAEGCGRGGRRELSRFLRLAMGSASELESQLLIAKDLGVVTQPAHQSLEASTVEVKRMLAGLLAKTALKTDN